MSIRPANGADIPVMMQLEKHAATAGHWSHEQYDAIFASDRILRKSIVLVIEDDKAVVGFLVARAIDTEWELENIVIAGPQRRRGLGSRLLGEFLEQVRTQGAGAIVLEVRESNQAARLLYEKWGFVQSGRRQRYYSNPEEAAVLYRLEIP